MREFAKHIKSVLLAGVVLLNFLAYAVPVGVQAEPIIPDALRPKENTTTLPKYDAGVDLTIKEYLCTPEGDGTDLMRCIGRLYRFGITAGAIILVAMVVIAGYIYITSGEAGKGKAKGMIMSSVVGMVILLGSSVLLNFINPNLLAIKPIQTPIFKSQPFPLCSDVGFDQDCITGSGQVSYSGKGVPGSASEAQYKDLIAKYAQANGLGYCQLSAVIQKESSFRRYIASNFGKPGGIGNIDANSSNKKFYNLTFTYAYPGSSNPGHGVGLTQVFIYGPPSNPKDRWVDSTTPSREGSRFGVKGFLTVTDLLDPDKNISAGAYHFAYYYKKNGNKLYDAYKEYTGGHSDTDLKKMMDFYTACEKRTK